ncbi:6407_t:CDS:2 [Cetraspora pellucida]|uniref:6407_t:CDS:1 n=1 Tax=Cetraspora pellucida TaxID=1433469 RepID=A0A9N9CV98_9GLOM|nr:6407_t:CDS:2 [Cetraspora pellucida]
MIKYSYNRLLRIIIRNYQIADIKLAHKILHIYSNQFEIDLITKEFIQKNAVFI